MYVPLYLSLCPSLFLILTHFLVVSIPAFRRLALFITLSIFHCLPLLIINYIYVYTYLSPNLVAYDPRRHQGMTLRRRRSRHPRASSPLDRRRRRMPSFTTPIEDLISPRHISQGSRTRGVIFPVFYFIMNFISPHVFKRAFAYLLLSLLGFWVGSSLFRDPIR